MQIDPLTHQWPIQCTVEYYKDLPLSWYIRPLLPCFIFQLHSWREPLRVKLPLKGWVCPRWHCLPHGEENEDAPLYWEWCKDGIKFLGQLLGKLGLNGLEVVQAQALGWTWTSKILWFTKSYWSSAQKMPHSLKNTLKTTYLEWYHLIQEKCLFPFLEQEKQILPAYCPVNFFHCVRLRWLLLEYKKQCSVAPG